MVLDLAIARLAPSETDLLQWGPEVRSQFGCFFLVLVLGTGHRCAAPPTCFGVDEVCADGFTILGTVYLVLVALGQAIDAVLPGDNGGLMTFIINFGVVHFWWRSWGPPSKQAGPGPI